MPCRSWPAHPVYRPTVSAVPVHAVIKSQRFLRADPGTAALPRTAGPVRRGQHRPQPPGSRVPVRRCAGGPHTPGRPAVAGAGTPATAAGAPARRTRRRSAGIPFPGITYPEVNRLGQVTVPNSVTVLGNGDLDVPGLGRIGGGFTRTDRGVFAVGRLTSGVLLIQICGAGLCQRRPVRLLPLRRHRQSGRGTGGLPHHQLTLRRHRLVRTAAIRSCRDERCRAEWGGGLRRDPRLPQAMGAYSADDPASDGLWKLCVGDGVVSGEGERGAR